MKTVTKPQIDVLEVTKNGDTYIAKYWDENFDGEHNATMQISEDALLDFLPDAAMFDDEHNRMYLTENLNEVVKDYIQANS